MAVFTFSFTFSFSILLDSEDEDFTSPSEKDRKDTHGASPLYYVFAGDQLTAAAVLSWLLSRPKAVAPVGVRSTLADSVGYVKSWLIPVSYQFFLFRYTQFHRFLQQGFFLLSVPAALLRIVRNRPAVFVDNSSLQDHAIDVIMYIGQNTQIILKERDQIG